MSLAIDPRLGVLTSLRRQQRSPDMPLAWVAFGANVARSREWSEFDVDPYGFGAALGDPDRAAMAAIGEAIERYCGNIVPTGLRRASYRNLRAAGEDAVDPTRLALFSKEQYAEPGFPFVPFTSDLEVAWALGRDVSSGADVWVPASLIYLDTRRILEPSTHPLSYAGIATGQDRSAAEQAALEELFERDASTLWWASGRPAILIEEAHEIVRLLDDPLAAERTVRLWSIPSEFGVPVVAAFIEDHVRELIAFGTAGRAAAREAAIKALVEAFGLSRVTAELADPESELWKSVAQGTIGPHTYQPYRADRRYLDSFRADLRDLVDLPAVAQLYLDPRMRGEPLDRLRVGSSETVRLNDIPIVSPSTYVSRLEAVGMRAVSVDVTTSDVAAAGLTVVRVVVPGLYGNAPAAFPYLGGWRLPANSVPRPPIPLA